MFVEKLEKIKNNFYRITIDGKEYEFSEDTVVKFRMAVGHETTMDEIKEAMDEESIHEFYLEAFRYALKYGRSEYEVRKYLYAKNLKKDSVDKITERLKNENVIRDLYLAESLSTSYIHAFNGRNMIRAKLYEKGFSKEITDKVLESMDMEEYQRSLEKLVEKSRHKYDKYDSKTRTLKLKNYLAQRGYTFDEINSIIIN